MTVDPRAASGFADTAGAYERARPSYPADAIADVARQLGVTASSTVLDLAAGTGKLTRVLLPLTGRVIAVDPSAPMLAQLREQLPDVDARTGTAEAIPAADGSVDAVFVAQAFHWFRSAEVGAEIARVLVPGGGLAVLWNRARWDEHPWAEEFQALVEPIREAAGSFPAGAWKHGLQESGLFAPLSEVEVDHVHRIGIDEFVDLVASWSWIANLPDEERTAVLGQVRGLVDSQPELALLYRTEIFWTHLA
ncbi:MAG: class I SAM-dependent methyltransferase [Solirubrobacteraceae bacterium]